MLSRFFPAVGTLIPANWPYNPKKSPFFYGWVVWVFSTLGLLFSIPGQTMGMAVFTDPLIEALELTRTELSVAYLFGTMASSLFLTQAGRGYDRYGARVMIVLSSIALGMMVYYISIVDSISELLGGSGALTFALMFLGYFGVRFFGQGVLYSCASNVLLLWFVKHRGLVTGVRAVFVSFGFSLAPVFLAWLIMTYSWRGALWCLTSLCIGYSLVALVFIRDSPESCGLVSDGGDPDEADTGNSGVVSKTLQDARRSPVFWIYSASFAMHSMFGTALTFHVVSIFAQAGRGRDEAFGYFFPTAIFATATSVIASWMVDRLPLKPFQISMLIMFMLGAYGLLNLHQSWGFWLLVAGFGTGGGLWTVTSNLAFIRFFGPVHLGEISGLNNSLTVFASAVGPAAFSLGFDYFGSYGSVVNICLAMLLCLLTAAIFVRQEEV